MTPLPHLAIYKVTGADAAGFLHAQLAADTVALTDGQSCFAAYCSPRGQVIALLLVCRQDSAWFIVTETGLADVVADRLRMYVLRAQVCIEACPEMQVAGLLEGDTADARTMVFSPGHTPLRYALTTPMQENSGAFLSWRKEEIRNGIIWLQRGVSERFLPQMLGLEAIGAVSFSKGCYPGQEIIARTRYLGKLKRHPVLLELQGSPDLDPGASCVLISAAEKIDSVVADAVCPDGETSTVLLVAPVESDQQVDALEFGAGIWPVRRI